MGDDKPIIIHKNNWSKYIKNTIGNAAKGFMAFTIGSDGGGVINPAPTCLKPLLFSADYTCGLDTTTIKTISKDDGLGKVVKFDCSTTFKKCASLKLTLDDSGILTLTDLANNQLWQSQPPKGIDPNNPPLALPEWSANGSNPNPGRHSTNSYLMSGESLQPSQWIGSPQGKFRLELTEYPDNGDFGTWVFVSGKYIGKKFDTPVEIIYKHVDQTIKWYQVIYAPGSPILNIDPKIFAAWMRVTTATANSENEVPVNPWEKKLQVVYNVLGCTDALTTPTNISPLNFGSTTLYSIDSINTQNVGKLGYVNSYGQLREYVDPTLTTYSSNSEYQSVGKYGVIGGDYGSPTSAADAAACQAACVDQQCAAFVYEKVGKTCQLKSPSVLTTGQRFLNDNYEYYVRTKGTSSLIDNSCPKSIDTSNNGTNWNADAWQNWPPLTDNNMTQESKCGLAAFTETLRNDVQTSTDTVIGASKKEGFTANITDATADLIGLSTIVASLTNNYNKLKTALFTTKVSQADKFNKLQEYKQGLSDWNGEQLAQLTAMDEDTELNMKSQNLKHNMYLYFFIGVLAIVVFGGIIMIVLSFFKKTATSVGPSATAASAATATAPSAATATAPSAAAVS